MTFFHFYYLIILFLILSIDCMMARAEYITVECPYLPLAESDPIPSMTRPLNLFSACQQDRIMSEEIWAGLGGDGVVVCLIYTPVPIGGECFNYAVEPFGAVPA